MTYLDTIEFDRIDADADIIAHIPSCTSDVAFFTPLEWQVIALAERDPLSSTHAPGRLAIAMGSLFGGNTHAGLADRRLETLRRLAVGIWHGQPLAEDDYLDFLDAGFSGDQLLLLSRSIERRRSVETSSAAARRSAFQPKAGLINSTRIEPMRAQMAR